MSDRVNGRIKNHTKIIPKNLSFTRYNQSKREQNSDQKFTNLSQNKKGNKITPEPFRVMASNLNKLLFG